MATFQTVGVFGNFASPDVDKIGSEIIGILDRNQVRSQRFYSTVNPEGANQRIDDDRLNLAIAVGGDGTFMNVARQRAGCRAPLLGVNLGRRGFLTDVAVREINESIQQVLDGDFSIETRTLLEVTTTSPNGNVSLNNALNDVVVHKTNFGRLMDFEILVAEEFVTSLRADGVIVSTPTGATAYALSAGGPVLYPTLPALVFIPVSPQTLTHRPIVLSDSSTIEIRLINATPDHSNLVVDGHIRQDLNGEERIVIQRSNLTVDFVRISGHTFYNALRQKLGWGV